ncbi:MAG: hypothetical protein IT424_00050 [Pirellulales bacterium]|nr:hypothetical protein [Pirellulales bacterium]
MRVNSLFALALFSIVAPIDGLQAAETFDSLAARIPGVANAIVLIDVEKTLAAPLAQQQGWAGKLEVTNVERPLALPPEANRLVLGAALDPREDFQAAWEVVVMELAEPIAVRSIARAESGFVDDVNGVAVAVIPRDAAFLDLGGNLLAMVRPAERQFLSRWSAAAKGNQPPELSPYLQSALRLVNDRVQILLAIDLTDVLGPRDIDARLAEATWLKDQPADAKAIAPVVAKLRGAALRIAVGAECQGQLQIDFDADVAPLSAVAGPLVLHALENLGFPAQEISQWDVSLAERSIRMRGVLSTAAQRRVMSVLELPPVDLKSTASPDAAPKAPTASEVRERSLAYFKSTQTLVDDLRKGLKDTKATSAWMERYARRIDELPVLNVDELLLDYGDKLAETLRVMALSKRQAGINYGVRASSGGSSYYGGYDYSYDAYAAAADRAQAKKEEMSVAADTRVEGWKLIDDATADIRRTLTKKYGVEF